VHVTTADVIPNAVLAVLCAKLDLGFERSANCLFITGLWLRYGKKSQKQD